MAQYEPMYDSFRRNPQEQYVPTSRMSVSASVYLPGSEVDLYTGQLKPDRQRRMRTQSKRLEAAELEREQQELENSLRRETQKGGVRIPWTMFALLMGVLLFLCGMSVLVQLGQISENQKEINRLERAIAECRTANAELETQVAEASDAAVICYAASQNLNMIPAESAEAIHLVAMDTRPMSSGQRAQTVVDQTHDVSGAVQRVSASNAD